MKLWIARNEGYEEEVLHDRFKHVSGELFISSGGMSFVDKYN